MSNEKEHLAAVCARFNEAPFYVLTGMRAESDEAGTARVTLPFDEKLTQLYGGLHGGMLMTLADAAANIALATTFTERETIATVELTVQFLEAAGPNEVVAEGRLLRRGKRLGFVEATLYADGRTICKAQGICHIGRAKR